MAEITDMGFDLGYVALNTAAFQSCKIFKEDTRQSENDQTSNARS